MKALLMLFAVMLCTSCAAPGLATSPDTRYRCDEVVIDSESCWDAEKKTS